MASIIEAQGLSHIYGVGTPFEHIAIHNVSFCAERGEVIGIIGHTGSGKSTLIQHLNGLLKPSSGKVLLDGVDIHKDKKTTRQARFRVGLVFQYPEYQLFEETVYKDISFGPKNMGCNDEEVHRRVMRAASFVNLTEELLQKSPFDLSGGQKRRAAIAGVIAMEPDVLILDEPTAGLDPAARSELLHNLQNYRKVQNATIIMVSHSMEEVAQMADRLIVMNRGEIAMQGTPKEVFAHAEQLREMGLSVPQVTEVALRLAELGIRLDASVFTVDQAVEAICKRGERHA